MVVVAKADGDWLGVVSLVLLKRKLEQLHFFFYIHNNNKPLDAKKGEMGVTCNDFTTLGIRLFHPHL